MLNITKRRETVTVEERWHSFVFDDSEGLGFMFQVNQDGNLITDLDAVRENYERCKTGFIDGDVVRDLGIEVHYVHYTEPAEGECVCGRTVILDGDVECDCGRWYNSAGQELKHPSLWEEW